MSHPSNVFKPMNPTWVLGFPHGDEKGTYLALDMGGTNIRICEVTLSGDGNFDIIQSKYRMVRGTRAQSIR